MVAHGSKSSMGMDVQVSLEASLCDGSGGWKDEGSEPFALSFICWLGVCWMLLVILSDQIGCMYLMGGLPRIVRRGICFPFDQVLRGFCSAVLSKSGDGLHFVFRFALN